MDEASFSIEYIFLWSSIFIRGISSFVVVGDSDLIQEANIKLGSKTKSSTKYDSRTRVARVPRILRGFFFFFLQT